MEKTRAAIAEIVLLFLIAPVSVAAGWVHIPALLALAAVAVPLLIWIWRAAPACIRPVWWQGGDRSSERRQLKRLLLRFLLSSGAMMAAVALFWPARLFALPAEAPFVWLAVVLLYPLLSVYPQEVVCRTYFFFRYAGLFPRRQMMVAASALAFGAIHLVYLNLPAMLLSLVGGWFFADTYERTRSFRLVWLEHSLYGTAVFTLGLGPFFQQGGA